MIHAGFYAAFFSVEVKIMNAIKGLKDKYGNPPIYTTGSSLGAALATIAGIEINAVYGNVKELHLFGCPRSGNQAYANFIKKSIPTIWRIVHDRDIVPHVPMVSQDFYHPPFEVLFDHELKEFKICDESG